MSNPDFVAPNYTTQDAATYKANIDAAIAANGADTINIGCSYNAGTGVFTIHDWQGTALSATNPGFVRFASKTTPGYVRYISVEASQSFIDDAGASEIVGNLFGLTTGRACTVDVPFYIYAVMDDTEASVAFMLSRVPGRTSSPASGSIGMPSSAVADTQPTFFSIDNVTAASYDSNPCVCIGSIRMRMSASDDWTVQALGNADGIGRFNESTLFSVPAGHFGADASSQFKANGGTVPVFSSTTFTYSLSRTGQVKIYFECSGDGGTDGSGAVSAAFIVPLYPTSSSLASSVGGVVSCAGLSAGAYLVTKAIISYDDTFFYIIYNGAAYGARLQWGDFTNGQRTVVLGGSYTI